VPIFHECQRGTDCCRWPGQVRLTNEEITRLAHFLGLIEAEFIQRHTRLRANRAELALQDDSRGGVCFS